ncbi:MAG: methylated-DNA--[protein]-cysteine S-methyltransferase [Kiritimatiellae bacterium]|nr:methylated-DNA--[protein]-cysteine S-methyltransferase [Kiritimatiellia bacterium]
MNVKTVNRTPFGPVALAWSGEANGPLITRVLIASENSSAENRAAKLYPHVAASSCRDVDQVADRIAAFLDGSAVAFSLDLLALDLCGTFREKVLRATHGIARGRVATYGGLAAHVGCPGGARAVGNAMATNLFPLIVPCHRVIRADLSLGSYGGGAEMKRGLLALEGVVPDARGQAPETQVVFGGR